MVTKMIVFDFYRTIYDPEAKSLFPGMRQSLSRLSKEFNLVLITTGGKERKQMIKNLKIGSFFKAVKIVTAKTQAVYQECLDKNELEPNQVLIIGDRKEEEIKIGKQLGAKTILVSYPKLKKKGGPYVERKIRSLPGCPLDN